MSKVEMTEKEARQSVANGWHGSGGQICAELWEAIKESLDLEFAPEPPPLPGRLIPERAFEDRGPGYCCWKDENGHRVLDLSMSLASPDRDRQREIVFRAFERANAYAEQMEAESEVI